MKTHPLSRTPRFLSIAGLLAILTAAILPLSAQQQSIRNSSQRAAVEKKTSEPKPAKLDRIVEKLKLSEPKAHENLTVYLIEGDDRFDTSEVLTLSEALGKKGKIVVKETGSVNELTVRNKGKGATVFIMAGDIVKGGQQDRTLGTDLPLETKAGEVPITAFCVEQGRWRARGKENVAMFESSANAVVSKAGKVAVRQAKDQGQVWDSVAKAQSKITANVGADVAARSASPTSLQLSLENTELKKKNQAFIETLKPAAEKQERSIGFVTVINGQINSAEIFAGHDLFRRAWPKLLESAAIEAISEQKEKAAEKPATSDEVMEFLAKAEDAKATKEKIQGSLWTVSAEGDSTLLFQTVDEGKDDRWLRRSVIKK